MQIVKISMVGANEHLPEQDVVDFIRAYPFAEIGIGVSREKGGRGTARFHYVKSLQKLIEKKCFPGRNGTIALHVNGTGKDGVDGWPYQICGGYLPDTLSEMMHFPRMSMQINSSNYDIPVKNAHTFARSNDLWRKIVPATRLILTYNNKTKEYVHKFVDDLSVHDSYILNWDILYDASFGNGQLSGQYAPPLFSGIIQGYAGGFKTDNITPELVKIKAAQTDPNAKIWIDAESGVRSTDGKTLDLTEAERFYKKVMEFEH